MNKSFTITIKTPKIRKMWSKDVNPVTRIFKSKKDYNRKDKSWKNDF